MGMCCHEQNGANTNPPGLKKKKKDYTVTGQLYTGPSKTFVTFYGGIIKMNGAI